LFGEFNKIARVLGVTAASSFAMSGVRSARGGTTTRRPPWVLGVEHVLGEERRHREDLVPGIEQGLQHGVERAAGAHGHEDVAGGVRQPGGRAKTLRHRLADGDMAGVGHVGMPVRLRAVEHAPRGGQHGRRWLDLRIA